MITRPEILEGIRRHIQPIRGQENLKLLIVVIIVVSILPAVIEIWRNKRKKK